MRRDFLHVVGGNDFWYGIGNFDDDDWCLRARIAGYKIAIVGGAFVQHVGHATFRLNVGEQSASLSINARKFARKWDIEDAGNPEGAYSRAGTVRHTRYDRDFHFIPVDYTGFSFPGSAYFPKTVDLKRILFVADWTSPVSEWIPAMSQLLRRISSIEVCFWIPLRYFKRDEVLTEIQKHVLSSGVDTRSQGIEFVVFSEDTPHVDTLRVMKSTDAIVRVRGDFVNRFIVHLAGELAMDIVDP